MENEIDRSIEELLDAMSLPENQGGDLKRYDHIMYYTFGIILPVILFVWGWY